MRTLFLAHNGVGLGHLVRLSRIAQAVHQLGGRPLFLCQSPRSPSSSPPFPTSFVPSLLDAPPEEFEALREDLLSVLESNRPSLLVEDTHPSRVALPPSIPRALIVRPVSWEYLLRLRHEYRHTYQAFLVADSPESPTWPYTDEQTAVIRSWPGWHVVGPVYRRPEPSDVQRVRSRLGLEPGAPLCLFTMGGGGQHQEGSDVDGFVSASVSLALAIRSRDPSAKFLFVRGPLLPRSVVLPPPFDVVEQEPDMHALLAAARCAVLRPGFNTTWECLAAGTLMHPVRGTSYVEPIDARTERLREHGLLPEDPVEAWVSDEWREQYRARCAAVGVRCQGAERLIAERLLELPRQTRSAPAAVRTQRRVLIMTINGIGIGHLVRSARLARALQSAGHKCFILIDTNNAPTAFADGAQLNLEMLPCAAAKLPASDGLSEIESRLRDFDPDVVVLDCHVPLRAATASLPGLRARYRLAVHSAPSTAVLQQITTRSDADFTMLLHDDSEFDALYGKSFPRAMLPATVGLAGGPVSRGPSLRSDAFRRAVPLHRFVLVVLGGGGEHPHRDDAHVIGGMVGDIAEHAWRRYGFRTICSTGPLFRGTIQPEHPAVTVYPYIHNLAAFVDAAEIVVARPGFNLAREVIGRNRVVFLTTYQFEEALAEQIAYFARVPEVRYVACESSAVIAAVDELVQRTGPVLPVSFGDGLRTLVEHVTKADCQADALRRLRDLVASFARPPKVAIRIDDVESLESMTGPCVRDLLSMGAHMSLEVIPYTHRLAAASLDAIDVDGRIEVAQHGYSHLPRRSREYGRAEFDVDTDAPEPEERDDLARGRDALSSVFGTRFAGGFSTPFDSVPPWLAAVWQQLGGRYLSYIWHRPPGARLPVVQVGVDPWDWERKRRWSMGEILRATSVSLVRRGEVGFVLHPERFSHADWHALTRVLAALFEAGAASVPLRELAVLQTERVVHSPLREYAEAPGAVQTRVPGSR